MLHSISNILEAISDLSGKVVSWLCLILVILMCYDVTMRYLFNQTSIAFFELEWHLFSLIFLLGAAYTFKHDKHVRVDVFYSKFSPRKKAWVNLIGTLVFLIPFCYIILKTSLQFANNSFQIKESSPDPGGLPARYLIKYAISLGFLLLMLQAIAQALRSFSFITQKQETNPS